MAENSFTLRYEATRYIRSLGSLRRRTRARALARLRALGPDGLEALHMAIDQEKSHWQQRQVSLSCVLMLLAGPTLVLFWELLQYALGATQKGGVACCALLLASLAAAGYMSLRKPASAYQTQLIALAELGDISSIGRLIEALDLGEAPTRTRAEIAVAALLPSITADNAWNIGLQQRTILYELLGGENVRLILAILNAVPILQDDYSLPMLEKLANSERSVARDRRVHTLVRSVLPLIHEIAARKSGKLTLLRASTGDATTAEALLRPADQLAESSSQELLRSVD